MKERGFRYVFPLIAAILWIAVFILFFREHSTFHSSDYAARQAAEAAARWLPSCLIGAILSTAASFVVHRLLKDIDDK
jgi:hypothetical protein